MGKTFHIVKRDGTLVPFDEQKIINAIEKANVTMEHEREKISPAEVQDILSLIQYRLETDEKNGKNLTVEEIQDIIVHSLLKMGHEKLGLSYECYRVTKSALRDMQTSTSFEQTYESIMKLVNGSNKDVQEENSNKDASINSTQRDLIAGEVSKYFTDKYLLPRKIVKAHEDGVLHFHDKDYFIQPMTNCFDKSERFITADGTKSFADFKDGDKVLVPTHKGNLKEATVKNFGIQKLQAVTFSKHRLSQKVVHCTANHRWILADGRETTDLKVGDKIFAAPILDHFEFNHLSSIEKQYWCYGFAIGDGSEYPTGTRVRLCNKKCEYKSHFESAGFNVTQPENMNGDLAVCLPNFKKQTFLENHEWINLDTNCKIALVNGLLAADGEFRNGIFPTGIATADIRIKELVLDLFEIAGYYIGAMRTDTGDTNYKKNRILYHIQLARTQYEKQLYTVTNIEPESEKDVWCLEVEDDHSFILEGGLVTGNCCLINISDMLDNGTVMNGLEIHSPHTFKTAATVMTQVVASVASNQYGFEK